jgi:ribosomal protein S26
MLSAETDIHPLESQSPPMTSATVSQPLPSAREDQSIVDARAPRFNQATVAALSVVALLTGAWPLFALLALQLTVSVRFGRQYCLPCVFYFKVVQPRLGPGKMEDSRAPRFANLIGAVFLSSATLAFLFGARTVGLALGGLVAALATLATVTGLCVGCELYRIIARVRGVKGHSIERVDLEQLGGVSGPSVVLFTHPLCSDCTALGSRLEREGVAVVKIDVSKRRDLAKKYGVSVVPLAFEVAADGRVLRAVS